MPIQLIITANDNGQINVSGPIENKVLAYGLLTCAQEAISEYHRQNERKVQPVSMMPPPLKLD